MNLKLHPVTGLGLILLALTSACTSVKTQLPRQTLTRTVNLPQFMGRWYVIASIPTMFETGAVNAVETYSWNEQRQRIDVDFRFRKDSPDGKEKVVPQKAFVHDRKTNAEWRIQLFWPLKFAYLIIDLADDYSDTTIGVPNRKHVWILARQPTMPAARYDAILEKLRTLGYDTNAVQKVPQIWPAP